MRKLKGYRVMAGLTQEDMAEHLGYSRVYYSYKENDIARFNLAERKTIFRLLKKSLPELKMDELFPIN